MRFSQRESAETERSLDWSLTMQKVEGRVLGAFSASPRGDSDGDGVSDQQQTDGSEKGASKARKNTRPKLTEADLFEGKIGARGLDSLRKRSVSARGGLSRGPDEQDDVSIRQDLNQPKKRAKANGNTTEKEAAANIRRWRAAQLNSQLVGKAYRQWGSDVAPALTVMRPVLFLLVLLLRGTRSMVVPLC